MGFHEVQFPTNISYGSAGGPGFNTQIIEVDSGAEERISRWSRPRHRYNLAYGIKNQSDLMTVKEFYIARYGPGWGFRFKDWLDYTTNADGKTAPTFLDSEVGVGDGSTLTFQSIKQYSSGGVTRTRKLEKPVAGTMLVSVAGVQQTSPGWTYPWSVNTTTGLITFTTAPGSGLSVKIGCEFDVPVRFGKEADELLEISLDAFDSGNIPNIPLIELIDPEPFSDEFYYGGAADISFTTDISITEIQGRVLNLTPGNVGLKVRLPDETALPPGGPYFYIKNASLTQPFDLETATFTTVATIPADTFVIVLLGVNSSSTATWYVIS